MCLISSDWPFCNAARRMKNAVLLSDDGKLAHDDPKAWDTLKWRRIIDRFGSDGKQIKGKGSLAEDEVVCISGQLTDLGRQTTLTLGQRLRHLYVDQLKFMPETISGASGIYLRSTHMSRAQESLQQTFTGMYLPQQRDPLFQPAITIRRSADDGLFPNNYACPRFNQLFTLFSKQAAAKFDESSAMNMLNNKLRKHMPDNAPVAVRGHPALAGIMDTNNARRAHGLSLPKEFDDPEVIQAIDAITVQEWFAGFFKNREYRSVGIGGLIGDINENITNHIGNTSSSFKLSLNGCHDTTIAGIMNSLGLFQGEHWPPFTSHIAIELFRKKAQPSEPPKPKAKGPFAFLTASSTTTPSIGRTPSHELSAQQISTMDGYYVRMRYNDRPVTIPGCRMAGKHLDGDESFCTLVRSVPPMNRKVGVEF